MLCRFPGLKDTLLSFNLNNSRSGETVIEKRREERKTSYSSATLNQLFHHIIFSYIVPTIELVLDRNQGHTSSLAFSPDGFRLLGGGLLNGGIVWDTRSGAQVLNTIERSDFSGKLKSSNHFASSVSFSPDGKKIMIVLDYGDFEDNGIVTVMDAWNGYTFLSIESSIACCSTFSPDGKRIACANIDNKVYIRDVSKGGVLLTLEGHRNIILMISYSDDGERIVTASQDGTVRVWHAQHGNQLLKIVLSQQSNKIRHRVLPVFKETIHSYIGGVHTLAIFSPNYGKHLLTGEPNNPTVRVWDSKSGELILSLGGHKKGVRSAAFSPCEGQYIVTVDAESTIRIWEFASGDNVYETSESPRHIFSLAFSPDGKRLALGGILYSSSMGSLLHENETVWIRNFEYMLPRNILKKKNNTKMKKKDEIKI